MFSKSGLLHHLIMSCIFTLLRFPIIISGWLNINPQPEKTADLHVSRAFHFKNRTNITITFSNTRLSLI